MTSEVKLFRLEEVRQHTSDQKTPWIIIDNQVFDVTMLVREHPGGDHILLINAGGDATEIFEDAGHSIDARELKKTFYIGDLHPDDYQTPTEKTVTGPMEEDLTVSRRPMGVWWKVASTVIMAILAYNAFY